MVRILLFVSIQHSDKFHTGTNSMQLCFITIILDLYDISHHLLKCTWVYIEVFISDKWVSKKGKFKDNTHANAICSSPKSKHNCTNFTRPTKSHASGVRVTPPDHTTKKKAIGESRAWTTATRRRYRGQTLTY